MSLSEVVKTRVDPAVKQRFEDACVTRETASSDVLRDFVAEYSGQKVALRTAHKRPEKDDTERRWNVVNTRLTNSERAKMQTIIDVQGESVTGWLLRLIRERIVAGPQVPKDELLAVENATYQLRSIGRNLNQMVRAINEGKADRGQFSESYAARLSDPHHANHPGDECAHRCLERAGLGLMAELFEDDIRGRKGEGGAATAP